MVLDQCVGITCDMVFILIASLPPHRLYASMALPQLDQQHEEIFGISAPKKLLLAHNAPAQVFLMLFAASAAGF
ncbi:hypothetical protein CUZ56_01886 [Saezia sanguinis]|uniref:Uncharacterized protein n=1 Tax=Saezia sanguinis TaxID=1965230 RepID=A0A433SD46_9BURK|nr:hypothetical protein CUZ56_01886 [Saezia sanguinis]